MSRRAAPKANSAALWREGNPLSRGAAPKANSAALWRGGTPLSRCPAPKANSAALWREGRPLQHLNIEPNFGIPGQRHRHATTPGDDFYALLIEGHRGLSDSQSELMNARLVLLLANHIGDLRVLHEAIDAARAGIAVPASVPASVPATVSLKP